MRSALYARSSTDKQEEAGTIHSQLDAILHNPTVQSKEVAEIYADDGVSGYTKPLWERPEGARLMADAEAGRWRRCELLVYRLNRLGRRWGDQKEAPESRHRDASGDFRENSVSEAEGRTRPTSDRQDS